MTDRDIFNPRDGEDFEAGVPNVRRRKPERAGKPRASRQDDIDAALHRHDQQAVQRHRSIEEILDEITERDGPNLKYRGRGRR